MTVSSVTGTKLVASYSQVVVPVDFSAPGWRVLTLANRIARAFGVPRHVVHVDTSSPWLDEGAHRLVLGSGPAGVRLKVDVVAARRAALGIVELAGQEQSLLVMSTRGHTAAAELLTGSTTDEVLRRWRGPLVLAGPRYRPSPVSLRRIVLCIDPVSAAVPPALAADIHAVAAAFGVPIEVLAVVNHGSSAESDDLLEQNRRLEAATDALSTDERVAKLVRLIGSRPGHEIARYVDATDGTLVALSTHARPLGGRVLFGSTALAVLRHVTSPVLVRRLTTR